MSLDENAERGAKVKFNQQQQDKKYLYMTQ